jgi:hypothetical protein
MLLPALQGLGHMTDVTLDRLDQARTLHDGAFGDLLLKEFGLDVKPIKVHLAQAVAAETNRAVWDWPRDERFWSSELGAFVRCENLAMGTNLTPKQAVDMWASEKNLYTWSPSYSRADFDAGSGHYTQLVWRKSTQVGCGSTSCARSVVISCRFSPAGNFMGQAVF